MGKATEPPKCKICGKAHFGLCPGLGDADRAASAIVDSLLPPARGRPKSQPKLQVIEGTPAEKLAKAREIIKEIEAKPTVRKAKESPAKATRAKPAKPRKAKPEGVASRPRRAAAPVNPQPEPSEAPRQIDAGPVAKAGEPKPARKGNRHKPGYMAEYMRKRRKAAKKGKPE